MSQWYRRVSNDIRELPACITYFEKEMEAARKMLGLKGLSLEKHAANLPGIVEHRFGQLQEIEAILEFLNIELKKTKSRRFKHYFEGYNKALSSRDASAYAEGDKEVVDVTMLVNEFALLRNTFLGITKGFETKNWMIGHVIRLRVAGLDDAQVE